ncbi:hypothetical protein ppKF707_3958 [Metapseudomonas furukawaii]|uniref:Uncharacterized protein n=1 Tax=Metapseudomonas furukawaii TaxID=1149133 RepID=A0AAD1BYX5_METFU|nr:hypothetical protein ppKF707_3958 [Pseudomonas furukawaii]BAU73742.1 hypothetical protein KF707C_20540 [Pseudomonas furukawaii]
MAACASFASSVLISGIGWNAVKIGMLPLLAFAALMQRPVRRTLVES